MKMIKYILPIFSAVLFLGCESDDDGFYNTKYVDATNLVTIETLDNYDVNDILFIEAAIPNLLPEAGQPNLLNVRESTGNAPSFDFAYILERRIDAENWEIVDVTNNFIIDQGDAEIGSYVKGILLYDDIISTYVYRGGITLAQTGEYRLSYTLNSAAPERVALRSNSPGNNVTLNIFSTTNALTDFNYYTFTVD